MNIKNLVYRKRNVSGALAALIPAALWAQPPQANNAYVQHNLVSDVAGHADSVDPNMVNPWGLVQSATSPFWASNHDKGNTTLYNGTGVAAALVVVVPAAGSTSTPGTPTGQVNGNGTSWTLANGRAASFIFATEDGTISAWNSGTTAEIKVDNSKSGAVYKGIASSVSNSSFKGIAATPASTAPMLYAANFNSGKIDVFDDKFAPATVSGTFTDPALPAGFAPFNIWNLGNILYVAYAKQDANKKLDVAGAGNGFVSSFDLQGNFQQRIVSNGALNSPWGIAIAPANWGAFGGALIVGNFGDGKINAFDLKTGNLLGTLQDTGGQPIVIQGLWALIFGNGRTADQNTLYFTAGPSFGDTKNHGLYGGIAPPEQVTGSLNAASLVSGAVAPGEIVELNGFSIGPSPLVAASIPAQGKLGTSVGTAAQGVTSVTFNGASAPILYASASATSVIVPYAIAGSTTANVVVTYRNNATASFQVQVVPTAPGLFTLSETGSGEVVAINADGTLNSATNPAAAGSPVLLFATGEGQTNPPGDDGAIIGRFVHTPVAKISLTAGGKDAIVAYAGSAPGNVAGVMMIEAVLPAGVTGTVPVVLTAGSASSQTGATIFVQ